MQNPDIEKFLPLIKLAYQEDYAGCDLTSDSTIPESQVGRGAIVFRQEGVLCGIPVVEQILHCYDPALILEDSSCDGDSILAGGSAGIISGPLRKLLAAERVILNFMQRLSAISTMTARYVAAVAGTSCKVCDTRKTTPGWRELEKYAVRCGGGVNHRYGLYDAVLIKDNHLKALGADNLRSGLEKAIENLSQSRTRPAFVQVEVDNLDQLQIVLQIDGIDMVLLDNMAENMLRQAVTIRDNMTGAENILLEASGNITLETLGTIAKTGIDRVSIGALTHSVKNLDIGLDLS